MFGAGSWLLGGGVWEEYLSQGLCPMCGHHLRQHAAAQGLWQRRVSGLLCQRRFASVVLGNSRKERSADFCFFLLLRPAYIFVGILSPFFPPLLSSLPSFWTENLYASKPKHDLIVIYELHSQMGHTLDGTLRALSPTKMGL